MYNLTNFNKFLRLPEKIPCDKRMHLILGLVFTNIQSIFTYDFHILIISLVLFAWVIEFYQKITKSGDFDHYDAIAVVIGGLISMISLINFNVLILILK